SLELSRTSALLRGAWLLEGAQGPVPKPARAQKPGLGRKGRRRDGRRRESTRDEVLRDVNGSAGELCEMLEVGRRRERVERGSVRGMVLPKVVEDVDDRVPDSARRGERAPMPAVRPEGAAPKSESVHVARDANREPAHSGAESALVERLDHEVHVIGLHREVDDAKRVR